MVIAAVLNISIGTDLNVDLLNLSLTIINQTLNLTIKG